MRRMAVLAIAMAAAAVGLTSCTPRPHYDFVVTSGGDRIDADPGDGICESTAGAEDCTLRAALQETNALAAAAPEPLVVTVTLDADVTLALAGADESQAASGDLDIAIGASEVHLHGAGHQVDAAGLDRAFDILSGTVLFDQVTVTGGRSVGPGGAIRTAAATAVGLVHSTFVDNRALVYGACLTAYILQGHCTTNAASEPNPPPGQEIIPTLPVGGGAIANNGRLVVAGSTFEDNGADSSAPLPCKAGSPQYLLCPATWGGAIQSTGDLFVALSTFVGNDALLPWTLYPDGDVSFVFIDPFGTAIHASGTSRVVASTVVDTSPRPSGAVAATTVQNSIVVSPSCGTPAIDADHNLRSPDPCGTPAPIGLGELGDHGGLTRTVVPEPTSPAVDAVAWEDCLGAPIDQRGQPRDPDQPCDIGAVERQPTDP